MLWDRRKESVVASTQPSRCSSGGNTIDGTSGTTAKLTVRTPQERSHLSLSGAVERVPLVLLSLHPLSLWRVVLRHHIWAVSLGPLGQYHSDRQPLLWGPWQVSSLPPPAQSAMTIPLVSQNSPTPQCGYPNRNVWWWWWRRWKERERRRESACHSFDERKMIGTPSVRALETSCYTRLAHPLLPPLQGN